MMRIRERERVYNIISWRWRQRQSRRRRWSARQLFVPLGRRFCRDTRQNPCHRVHDYDYGHDEDEDDEKKRRAHTLTHTRIIYSCVYTWGRACVTDDSMSNYYSWEKALYTSSSTTIIIDYNIIMVLIILLLCAGARQLVPFTWKKSLSLKSISRMDWVAKFIFSLLKILYSLVMFITIIILHQILIMSNVVISNISESRTFFLISFNFDLTKI